MAVAKFVSNVFLVAIFDATFADQMLKSDQPFSEKWMSGPSKKKKKKKNTNLEKYGISKMNLESAILDLTKYPKVT